MKFTLICEDEGDGEKERTEMTFETIFLDVLTRKFVDFARAQSFVVSYPSDYCSFDLDDMLTPEVNMAKKPAKKPTPKPMPGKGKC